MGYEHPGRGSGFPWTLRRRRCTLARLSRRKFIPSPISRPPRHLMDVRPKSPLSPLSRRCHPASISTTVAPSWSCVRCVRHAGPLRISTLAISRFAPCLFLLRASIRLNKRLWKRVRILAINLDKCFFSIFREFFEEGTFLIFKGFIF